VRSNSLRLLVIVASLFFFTNNLSGSFLPIYFRDSGLSMIEIVEVSLFTFLVLGFLPIILLRVFRNFEGVISVGIFTTMLFFIALICIKNPIILGIAQGISLSTFWPSFNLLQFRLSESKTRARTISILSSIIPSFASIIGPAVGGFIIENLDFTFLFAVSIILYLIAFAFSTRIRFKFENYGFLIPKCRMFAVFFITFIIAGLIEAYWLVYPFFVLNVSGTVLNMGLVLASTGIFVSIITFLVNWFSDIRKARVEFAIIGVILNAAWYFAIGFTSSMYQIIVLSLLSGFASAFRLSWFVHYGDSFSRDHYASILVMMETGLMIGRIMNLAPAYVFLSQSNYLGYFMLLGTIALSLIPLYAASKSKTNSKNQ